MIKNEVLRKKIDFHISRSKSLLSQINIKIILEFSKIESFEYKYNRREIKKRPISLNL